MWFWVILGAVSCKMFTNFCIISIHYTALMTTHDVSNFSLYLLYVHHECISFISVQCPQMMNSPFPNRISTIQQLWVSNQLPFHRVDMARLLLFPHSMWTHLGPKRPMVVRWDYWSFSFLVELKLKYKYVIMWLDKVLTKFWCFMSASLSGFYYF